MSLNVPGGKHDKEFHMLPQYCTTYMSTLNPCLWPILNLGVGSGHFDFNVPTLFILNPSYLPGSNWNARADGN